MRTAVRSTSQFFRHSVDYSYNVLLTFGTSKSIRVLGVPQPDSQSSKIVFVRMHFRNFNFLLLHFQLCHLLAHFLRIPRWFSKFISMQKKPSELYKIGNDQLLKVDINLCADAVLVDSVTSKADKYNWIYSFGWANIYVVF